eukprot:TRINITY_DN4546_c0_g1_i1.p1 TRINITY_DN4546_c0_g1~~TRINITY_DN4546_c0_g1_i1.p1  ORF type:complete len:1699 (+),score=317.31 TRINITY_DN4546_c0_g1_i1:59-5155(+)
MSGTPVRTPSAVPPLRSREDKLEQALIRKTLSWGASGNLPPVSLSADNLDAQLLRYEEENEVLRAELSELRERLRGLGQELPPEMALLNVSASESTPLRPRSRASSCDSTADLVERVLQEVKTNTALKRDIEQAKHTLSESAPPEDGAKQNLRIQELKAKALVDRLQRKRPAHTAWADTPSPNEKSQSQVAVSSLPSTLPLASSSLNTTLPPAQTALSRWADPAPPTAYRSAQPALPFIKSLPVNHTPPAHPQLTRLQHVEATNRAIIQRQEEDDRSLLQDKVVFTAEEELHQIRRKLRASPKVQPKQVEQKPLPVVDPPPPPPAPDVDPAIEKFLQEEKERDRKRGERRVFALSEKEEIVREKIRDDESISRAGLEDHYRYYIQPWLIPLLQARTALLENQEAIRRAVAELEIMARTEVTSQEHLSKLIAALLQRERGAREGVTEIFHQERDELRDIEQRLAAVVQGQVTDRGKISVEEATTRINLKEACTEFSLRLHRALENISATVITEEVDRLVLHQNEAFARTQCANERETHKFLVEVTAQRCSAAAAESTARIEILKLAAQGLLGVESTHRARIEGNEKLVATVFSLILEEMQQRRINEKDRTTELTLLYWRGECAAHEFTEATCRQNLEIDCDFTRALLWLEATEGETRVNIHRQRVAFLQGVRAQIALIALVDREATERTTTLQQEDAIWRRSVSHRLFAMEAVGRQSVADSWKVARSQATIDFLVHCEAVSTKDLLADEINQFFDLRSASLVAEETLVRKATECETDVAYQTLDASFKALHEEAKLTAIVAVAEPPAPEIERKEESVVDPQPTEPEPDRTSERREDKEALPTAEFAAKIQRSYRAHLARVQTGRLASARAAEREKEADFALQVDAVMRMQAFFRMVRAKQAVRKLRKMRKAATAIQALLRGGRARRKAREERQKRIDKRETEEALDAVIRIQSLVRRFLGRIKVARLARQKQLRILRANAILRIQRWARQVVAKRQVRMLRQKRAWQQHKQQRAAEQQASALMIQAVARRFLALRKIKEQRAAKERRSLFAAIAATIPTITSIAAVSAKQRRPIISDAQMRQLVLQELYQLSLEEALQQKDQISADEDHMRQAYKQFFEGPFAMEAKEITARNTLIDQEAKPRQLLEQHYAESTSALKQRNIQYFQALRDKRQLLAEEEAERQYLEQNSEKLRSQLLWLHQLAVFESQQVDLIALEDSTRGKVELWEEEQRDTLRHDFWDGISQLQWLEAQRVLWKQKLQASELQRTAAGAKKAHVAGASAAITAAVGAALVAKAVSLERNSAARNTLAVVAAIAAAAKFAEAEQTRTSAVNATAAAVAAICAFSVEASRQALPSALSAIYLVSALSAAVGAASTRANVLQAAKERRGRNRLSAVAAICVASGISVLAAGSSDGVVNHTKVARQQKQRSPSFAAEVTQEMADLLGELEADNRREILVEEAAQRSKFRDHYRNGWFALEGKENQQRQRILREEAEIRDYLEQACITEEQRVETQEREALLFELEYLDLSQSEQEQRQSITLQEEAIGTPLRKEIGFQWSFLRKSDMQRNEMRDREEILRLEQAAWAPIQKMAAGEIAEMRWLEAAAHEWAMDLDRCEREEYVARGFIVLTEREERAGVHGKAAVARSNLHSRGSWDSPRTRRIGEMMRAMEREREEITWEWNWQAQRLREWELRQRPSVR